MQDEKTHTELTRKQLVDEIFRLNDEIDRRIAEAEVGGKEWQRGYEEWKASSQDQINAARNKIALMRTQDVSARDIAIAAIIAVVEVETKSRKEAGTGSGIFDPLNDKWVVPPSPVNVEDLALLKQSYDSGVADERERCARVAETMNIPSTYAQLTAAAIRKGEKR